MAAGARHGTGGERRENAAGRWQPSLGAWPEGGGYRFRVWAPERDTVDLLIREDGLERRIRLAPERDGLWTTTIEPLPPRARYGYVVDDQGPFPDPASRWQPDGVHGLSALVDARGFPWTTTWWTGVPVERAVFYEIHVGTFTPAGTFAGVAERLPYLRDLGVTVLELMPIAEFPGTRNWGYDGASLFAPSHNYGTPDDLRRLVDAAHAHGLGVVLDVVYNHFGPDGAYAFAFTPHYASGRHASPWGAAVNFDGPHAAGVRTFVIENACHWLHEYRFDGLRFDATHAIVDGSPTHIIAALTTSARQSVADRPLLFVAEDSRNLPHVVEPVDQGGWGCDAEWSDDFHHQARRMLAGDCEAYYQDFTTDIHDLATILERGWLYVGQHSAHEGHPRGADPRGIPVRHMVVCLQNHDQVGNRAYGERLNHQVAPAIYRAMTALLLCAPETPLLFMGQEWAAVSPFCFFTDHEPRLGQMVTEGRRREFAGFSAFRDEQARMAIPDPQAVTTFEQSRLNWAEHGDRTHAGCLALHRTLLHLRQSDPALASDASYRVFVPDAETLVLERRASSGREMVLVAHLGGPGEVDVSGCLTADRLASAATVLTTQDVAFAGVTADDTSRPPVRPVPGMAAVRFAGPAAILLRIV